MGTQFKLPLKCEHTGNAINRQSQLSLAKSQANLDLVDDGKFMVGSGGLYAPTIRHHQGTFYVVCTNVIRSPGKNRDATENFIVSTDDIWSGIWSDPIYFEFDGIDPVFCSMMMEKSTCKGRVE